MTATIKNITARLQATAVTANTDEMGKLVGWLQGALGPIVKKGKYGTGQWVLFRKKIGSLYVLCEVTYYPTARVDVKFSVQTHPAADLSSPTIAVYMQTAPDFKRIRKHLIAELTDALRAKRSFGERLVNASDVAEGVIKSLG